MVQGTPTHKAMVATWDMRQMAHSWVLGWFSKWKSLLQGLVQHLPFSGICDKSILRYAEMCFFRQCRFSFWGLCSVSSHVDLVPCVSPTPAITWCIPLFERILSGLWTVFWIKEVVVYGFDMAARFFVSSWVHLSVNYYSRSNSKLTMLECVMETTVCLKLTHSFITNHNVNKLTDVGRVAWWHSGYQGCLSARRCWV